MGERVRAPNKLVHTQDCPGTTRNWCEGTRFGLYNEMVPSTGSARHCVPYTEEMDHF